MNKCNFYDCFKYNYSQRKLNCNECYCIFEETITLHKSPKILVIFLENNKNCNYILELKIDLKKLPNQFLENINGIYMLKSILSYNILAKEIIVYYFNLKEKSWYIYSKIWKS